MKQKLKAIAQHPLISGSAIIFFGSLFANVFNFLFTVFMIARLSDVDYGILAAILSLISLPSLAAGAIAPAIVNFAAAYFAKNEIAKAHSLYTKVGKIYMLLGTIFFIGFLLFIPQISEFFRIPNHFLLVLSDIAIFMSFFYALNIAFLQARLAFAYIAILLILAASSKFLFGLSFTNNGLAINGAVLALFISFIIPFFVSFAPLRRFLKRRTEKPVINMKELFAYALPSGVTVLGITSFITADILLVKHFFPPADAGYYASIATIAKIIFYFSSPIGTVMFPLVVQKLNRNENYTSIFFLSLILVLLPSIALTAIYFLFPEFILNIFHVKNIHQYDMHLLGYFGVFISLYALVSVLTNFYLSIKKTKIYIVICIAAIAQILGIWFFHDDFFTVLFVSSMSMFLLLISLLLYYPYATKE